MSRGTRPRRRVAPPIGPDTVPTDHPPYLTTTLVLVGVIALSQAIPWAQRAFGGNVPPLFARLSPSVGPGLVVAVALVGSAWVVVPWLLRARTAVFLAGIVAFGWVVAVVLAIQAHGFGELSAPLRNPLDYQASVPLLREFGLRGFVERYPDLAAHLSLHARTHPPGAVVFLWATGRLVGGNLTAVALVVALVGALGAVPSYALARGMYEEPACRLAAALFASAPGVLLFSATSLDAVFMTIAAVALMALVRAPRSGAWAFAAGALTAVALSFTYGVLMFAVVGVGIGLVAWRGGGAIGEPRGPSGDRVPMLVLLARGALAIAGLILGALALHLATGFDPVGVLRSTLRAHLSDPSRVRPYAYWLFADIPAFLIMAGFPQTALFVAEVRAAWRRPRRLGLESVLVMTLVVASVSGIFLGEVDHIWLFFLPLLVAPAGHALVRSDGVGGARGPIVAALAQAVLMEILLYTFW
jgi:hypothetical protein